MYIRLARRRGCKPSTKEESKRSYERDKAKVIGTIIERYCDPNSSFGRSTACNIFKRAGGVYKLDVHPINHANQLTIEDVIVLHDTQGGSTNSIYRFASALVALRPDLYLFPR